MNNSISIVACFLLGISLAGGCGSDAPCVVDSECALTSVCVDGSCEERQPPDAGTDGQLPDATLTDVPADVTPDVDSGEDGGESDAAASDAADAGGVDSGRDAGPLSFCDRSEAWMCEDFEDESLPAWRTGDETPDATTMVSSGRSRSGMRALRSDILRGGGSKSWNRALPSSLNSGTVYVRAWIYLEAGDYRNIGMWGLGERRGAFDSINAKVFDNSSGMFDTVRSMQTVGAAVEFDQWQCWLLEIGISETAGTISLSIDGTPQLLETGRDTLFGEGFAGMFIGTTFSLPTQSPITYWMDEVEVDTERLSCPSP